MYPVVLGCRRRIVHGTDVSLLSAIFGEKRSLIAVVTRYHRVGFEWAGSILAFIALACCAIPYLFYFKGAAIRKHSKYAYSDGDERCAVDVGH